MTSGQASMAPGTGHRRAGDPGLGHRRQRRKTWVSLRRGVAGDKLAHLEGRAHGCWPGGGRCRARSRGGSRHRGARRHDGVGTHENHHTRTGRGHSFGDATARKSAPTPTARRRLPGGRRAGKGDRSPGSRSEAADARRKLEAAHRTRGLPCHWPGCTFGPQPETGAAGRGVGGRRPEPCCWGPIPAGVAGLPEWPLAVGVRRLFISMLRPWLFCMCLNS